LRIRQFFVSEEYILTEINVFLILENHGSYSLQFHRLNVVLVIVNLHFKHMFVHTLPFRQTSGNTGPALEYMCIIINKWLGLTVVFMPPKDQVNLRRDVFVMHPPVVHNPVQVGFGPGLVGQQDFDTLLHRQ